MLILIIAIIVSVFLIRREHLALREVKEKLKKYK